jgi:integrator complex subunit 1
MVKENENNLRHVLNLIIYNELSTQRHPNNLPILGTILASIPESRTVLAETFIELLQKREDFHQALRLLLREIVRTARHECDLLKFVVGLIQHRVSYIINTLSYWLKRLFYFIQDITWLGECRERAFMAIADLILLSMFLSVSPQVREASAVAAVRGEPKDISTLIVCWNQLVKKYWEIFKF